MDQVQSSHPSQNTDNTTSWYVKDLKDLKPNARELFEKYSKIPSEDVVAHITQFVSHVRDSIKPSDLFQDRETKHTKYIRIHALVVGHF